MKVLIVGSGGREHALAWKCAQSPKVSEVLVAPGNGGTATEPRVRNVDVAAEDIAGAGRAGQAPNASGSPSSGPRRRWSRAWSTPSRPRACAASVRCKAAAQLEGSKAFTKEFLKRHGIPDRGLRHVHARHLRCRLGAPAAHAHCRKGIRPGGRKGCASSSTAPTKPLPPPRPCSAGQFGSAGDQVVIEEFLPGEEASFIVMADGRNILTMATSQDHKRLRDARRRARTPAAWAPIHRPRWSRGPCTSASCARSSSPPSAAWRRTERPIPDSCTPASWCTLTARPNVLEYNCRFGDPETQPIMMRLRSDLVELCEAALDKRLDRVHADWDERAALGVVLAAEGYPETVRKGDVIAGLDAAAKLSPMDGQGVPCRHAGRGRQDPDQRRPRAVCRRTGSQRVAGASARPTRWSMRFPGRACSAGAISDIAPWREKRTR